MIGRWRKLKSQDINKRIIEHIAGPCLHLSIHHMGSIQCELNSNQLTITLALWWYILVVQEKS